MLHDGIIGEKSVLVALSSLTTGNLNSKLKQGATGYKMQDILPMSHDYIVPPLTDEEKKAQVQRDLLAFMRLAPNAPEIITNDRQANL